MVCGLILEKLRGLSVKYLKLDFSGIVFLKKTCGLSPRVCGLRRPGPPWTGGHCHSRELIGARPLAALVPESSDRGVGERKGGPVNSMAGLPRLGRRWKSVSPATETSARKDDGAGAVRAKRGGIRGVGGFTEDGGEVGEGRAPSIAGLNELQWRG
jgi:hypothetical protein